MKQLNAERMYWFCRYIRLERAVKDYLSSIDENDWTTEDQMLLETLENEEL